MYTIFIMEITVFKRFYWSIKAKTSILESLTISLFGLWTKGNGRKENDRIGKGTISFV